MRYEKISITAVALYLLLATGLSYGCEAILDKQPSQPLSLSQAQQELALLLLRDQRDFELSVQAQGSIETQVSHATCHLRALANRVPELIVSAKLLEQMASQLEGAGTDAERRFAIDQLNDGLDRDASTGYVLFPSGDKGQPTEKLSVDLFAKFLTPSCAPAASADCASAMDSAFKLWWINGMFRDLASRYNQVDIARSLDFTERLDRQWKSYKEDTIQLWPQEVLLSSIAFNNKSKGFSPPPNYKILALRPSLGLSYLSDDKNHIKPTLNVDLLGIYWWEYGGDQGIQAQPGRGISASLIWDGDDTAYGLSYHHNPRYSFSIAKGDENDVVVSVSLQLAYLLFR